MVEQERVQKVPQSSSNGPEEGPPFPYDNKVTVTVTDQIGIIAMSIIAMVLLIALLRAQERIRELQQMQE